MQPHSMCVVALANVVWNSGKMITHLSSASMNVSYENSERRTRNMKYDLSQFQLSSDRREFSVSVMRGGGGLACTVTARTNADGHVVMTHSNQHVSGLREEFNLYKDAVKSGRHYNSMKYKDFSGTISNERSMKLTCEIKVDKNKYISVPYELSVTSLVYSMEEVATKKKAA